MLLRTDVIAALAVAVGIGLAAQTSGTEATSLVEGAESHRAVSFANEVMPILEQYCSECHGEESAELGLKLDSYEGVMAGSDYGTVVEAGNADGSLIIDMISSGDMPEEGGPVPPELLEVLKTWINEGAENN